MAGGAGLIIGGTPQKVQGPENYSAGGKPQWLIQQEQEEAQRKQILAQQSAQDAQVRSGAAATQAASVPSSGTGTYSQGVPISTLGAAGPTTNPLAKDNGQNNAAGEGAQTSMVGGLGSMADPSGNMLGPMLGALRGGIGTRSLPSMESALAGLRKAY